MNVGERPFRTYNDAAADRSGCYLDDCQISMSEAYASDEAAAEKLWELSAQMTDATVH